jgi:hypothetical protein
MLGERKDGKRFSKSFLFPASALAGEEEKQCHSKRHCFGFLSFF